MFSVKVPKTITHERRLTGAGEDVRGFLEALGGGDLSPEAMTALSAYRGVAPEVKEALASSVSGRELRNMGFEGDVAVAAEVGASDVVPVLFDGWFSDFQNNR